MSGDGGNQTEPFQILQDTEPEMTYEQPSSKTWLS